MSENVLEKFVELATDICKRNGKSKLLYFGDNKEKTLSYIPAENEMVILFHKWFADNRTCPEKYFISRCSELVERINKNLSGERAKTSTIYRVQCGAFANRNNAEKMCELLEKTGFESVIVSG